MINSELSHLYESISLPTLFETALAESFANAVNRHGEILFRHGIPLGRHSEIVYKYGIALRLPKGVLEGEKAKSIACMLFRGVLEPLLLGCGRETIEHVRDEMRRIDEIKDTKVEIEDVGVLNIIPGLDSGGGKIIKAFSEIMNSCYPIICGDIGAEKAENILTHHFHHVIELCTGTPYRYELEEIIPEGILEEEREWTGIRGISKLVKEGLPREKVYMVAGYKGAEITLLGEQFIWNGLIRGETCLYATSRESPSRVKSRMLSQGWDVRSFEEEGLLIWVDCFSCTLPNPEKEDFVILSSSIDALPEVRLAISEGIKSVAPKRAVLDIFSTLIERHGIKAVFPVLQEIIARLSAQGVSVLILVDGSMHDESTVASIAHLCDGVIVLEQVEGIERGKRIRNTYLYIERLNERIYDSSSLIVEKNESGMGIRLG